MASSTPAAPIPPQARSKNLRACLLCSIIQTPIDFRRNGCPNCEEIMQVTVCPRLESKGLAIDIGIDEGFSRSYPGLHDDTFRRVCCGHRPGKELGGALAKNKYVLA